MKLYDCSLYYDEDLILNARLNILNKYFDKFIICESKYSHSGRKKKLNFNINNFSEFKDKIIYVVNDKEPDGLIYRLDKEKKIEFDILSLCKTHLEDGKSLRSLDLEGNQIKWIKYLNLITLKPLIYVANIDESLISDDNHHVLKLSNIAKEEGLGLIKICASLEEQLYELTDDEKALFLDDYAINESGLDKLIRTSYDTLDLITYFTAGEKEVRAWTVKKGSLAPQAAGVIHTDFEKGFIKAEVIKYDDFISFGSELKCKEAGKLSMEGKEYIVKDGDVLNFRFNT